MTNVMGQNNDTKQLNACNRSDTVTFLHLNICTDRWIRMEVLALQGALWN